MSDAMNPAVAKADAGSDARANAGSDAGEAVALTSPLHLPHAAATCPKCLANADHDWWSARPDGARLVGLVIAREGMPSVTQQREDLTRFGVPIEGFRHPAPEILQSWGDRLAKLIDTLQRGDVLVVANVHALGNDTDEEARTVAELRRRGIMVKVLGHHARHLADAQTSAAGGL